MKSLIRKIYAAALCVMLLALCACGETDDPAEVTDETVEFHALSVSLPGNLTDLDPLYGGWQGNETIMVHIYENLMRRVDGGDGWAVLAPGQAEGYTVETDYAGNATYTFTLREDLRWSNGLPVTAGDFVYSWQLLADTEVRLPHRELLSCIQGFDEAPETGGDTAGDGGGTADSGAPDGGTTDGGAGPEEEKTSQLAVSAPDDRTFVVKLKGNPAYFLEEVCASMYTVPRDPDSPDGSFFNGPYVPVAVDASHVGLERNTRYYAPETAGPDEIHFYSAGEADAELQLLQAGERDLITALPEDALRELAEGGLWTPEPVRGTYGVLFNTLREPFDDGNVRLAFHLAVDRRAVTDALHDFTARPAPGIVPYGVADFSERPVAEASTGEDALPDPIAGSEPEEDPDPVCWDFRVHASNVVTAEHFHDYETDFRYAQALMAQAGYAGGSGFPEVEYIYVYERDSDRIVAGQLQRMWQDCLGVKVNVREVGREEYEAALTPVLQEGEDNEAQAEEAVIPAASFQLAAKEFSPAYSDAGLLLEQWYSESGDNVTGYANDAFDILIRSVRASAIPNARDAYLHDAEAILMEDSPVVPVFCRGGGYRLREGLAGLYRAPDGVFFLCGVHRLDGVG